MHTAGKVMVWVVVVLAFAAIYFSARVLKTQREWQAKADGLRANAVQNAESLNSKQRELSDLQQELSRVMMPWDRYWNNVAVQLANPQQGDIRAAIGTNNLVGAPLDPGRPKPVLHAFRPTAEDGYVYVGPFQAIEVRETSTVLHPAWRLRASDVEHFNIGNEPWRFRAMIPSVHEDRFRSLEVDLAVADEALIAKVNYVKEQLELIQLAQEHYDLRVRELLGAGAGEGDNTDLDEYVVGLQSVIAQVEGERNALLAELHHLRGVLRDRHAELEQLATENNKLAESLPQPSESAEQQVTVR